MSNATTDEAMEVLRKLWEHHHKNDWMLTANILCHPDGSCEEVWQVIDGLVYATVVFDGGWEEAVIATGPTPAAAILAAKAKLEDAK